MALCFGVAASEEEAVGGGGSVVQRGELGAVEGEAGRGRKE